MLLPTLRQTLGALGGAAVLATAACSSDDGTGPTDSGPSAARADTLDTRVSGSPTGATRWVYVSLANPGQPLALTDEAAATSTAWDVAFNGFATRTNPAASVSVVCLCQNSASAPAGTAAAAYYGAMTSDTELAEFSAVGAGMIPEATQFRADSILAISDWFTASGGTRAVQPNVYVIQRPNGAGYAKVQVTAVQSATGTTPERVSVRYATTDAARSAFGATQNVTVDVPATGRVLLDLGTGRTTTGTNWDLAFEGWRIRTNSGSSSALATPTWGAYNATALLRVASFDALGPNSVSPTSNAYRADGYGVFGDKPTWYYDAANRTALPTYDVYLLKRGPAVYKLQVTGFRRQVGADIVANHVAFRSARLSG